jgi:hypothetical protein
MVDYHRVPHVAPICRGKCNTASQCREHRVSNLAIQIKRTVRLA